MSICDECKDIRIVDDPIMECFNYVKENFDYIHPFEIESGYSFRIECNIEQYSVVPEKYKEELRKFASNENVCDYDDDVHLRYKKDFFWLPANMYFFDFDVIKALCVYTECEYGPEGLEECQLPTLKSVGVFREDIVRVD